MKCPYCSSAQGRCATTSSGRSITECGLGFEILALNNRRSPLQPMYSKRRLGRASNTYWRSVKCFCTRRNPISISAAAIYLACQLEDKRKTQAEICKITGLTEVTLRKVYKELLRELGRSSPV
ncbi:unnamed protein product [Brassica rapa subsp. narinosa]